MYKMVRNTQQAAELHTIVQNEPNSDNSEHSDRYHAVIHCGYIAPIVSHAFKYIGYTDCNIKNKLFGGTEACQYGCLGAGSCARMCPKEAITLSSGIIRVTDDCNGCGRCLAVCPRHLIELVPKIDTSIVIPCAAKNMITDLDICPAEKNDYTISVNS